MSPAVIKGDKYDYKADIWSLGIVGYEMVDGYPPYIDYPPLKAVFLIATQGLHPIDVSDRCSEEVVDFISQCTTVDAKTRPTAKSLLSVSCLLSLRPFIF